jgi:hypothetical protein
MKDLTLVHVVCWSVKESQVWNSEVWILNPTTVGCLGISEEIDV